MSNVFYIVVVAVVSLLLWVVRCYNRLIKRRNLKDEAWSGIDVQLKRRSELVPNLVETVRGYAAHEKETLKAVTAARNAAVSSDVSPEARINAENALTGGLRTILALAERYPALKANANFEALQGQLSSLENDLQMARRYYNGTTREYNTACESFPTNLLARLFDFDKAPYFETDEMSRVKPTVNFKNVATN